MAKKHSHELPKELRAIDPLTAAWISDGCFWTEYAVPPSLQGKITLEAWQTLLRDNSHATQHD